MPENGVGCECHSISAMILENISVRCKAAKFLKDLLNCHKFPCDRTCNFKTTRTIIITLLALFALGEFFLLTI